MHPEQVQTLAEPILLDFNAWDNPFWLNVLFSRSTDVVASSSRPAGVVVLPLSPTSQSCPTEAEKETASSCGLVPFASVALWQPCQSLHLFRGHFSIFLKEDACLQQCSPTDLFHTLNVLLRNLFSYNKYPDLLLTNSTFHKNLKHNPSSSFQQRSLFIQAQ